MSSCQRSPYIHGMRLKAYLQQINPLLSDPEAARRLLRLLAIVLSAGILGAAYNFLSFTFNTDIARRHGAMSSAIAEAHTFFTNREALLESLSLAAVRQTDPLIDWVPLAPGEEVHLQLGSQPHKRWSLWLTQRMCAYLKARQVNLLYVDTAAQAPMRWLYHADAQAALPSPALLEQLRAAGNDPPLPRSCGWPTTMCTVHACSSSCAWTNVTRILAGWAWKSTARPWRRRSGMPAQANS